MNVCLTFREVDKHAIAVYKHNFKNSKYVGSVTDVRGEQLPKIDVITFGSPCQDFSLAESVKGWEVKGQALSLKQLGSSMSADQEFLFGKMLKELSPQTMAKILRQSSKPLPTLGAIDLNGNCVIHRGFYPKTERESTLSDILQKPQEIGEEFFLSKKMTDFLMQRQGKQMGDYKVGDLMCTNNNCKILEDGLI